MKKIFVLLSLLMLACIPLHARSYYKNQDLTPYIHEMIGFFQFEGDKHGEFKEDVVVILDDISLWKVHPDPDQIEVFKYWKMGEKVHVAARTSWYFFKREHKFMLCNHDRNETVKVMMVGSSSLIALADDPQASATYNYQDIDFRVNITLNDGSDWEVEVPSNEMTRQRKDMHFAPGTPAFVGYNDEGDGEVCFFIINEVEREAVWRWARKGNGTYTR